MLGIGQRTSGGAWFAMTSLRTLATHARPSLVTTKFIDCAGVTSTDEFWQRYLDATQADGAQHFGRNLDAFWDAVEGRGPGWPGLVKLVFVNSDDLSALTNRAGTESFLTSLRQIASKVTAIEIELA